MKTYRQKLTTALAKEVASNAARKAKKLGIPGKSVFCEICVVGVTSPVSLRKKLFDWKQHPMAEHRRWKK